MMGMLTKASTSCSANDRIFALTAALLCLLSVNMCIAFSPTSSLLKNDYNEKKQYHFYPQQQQQQKQQQNYLLERKLVPKRGGLYQSNKFCRGSLISFRPNNNVGCTATSSSLFSNLQSSTDGQEYEKDDKNSDTLTASAPNGETITKEYSEEEEFNILMHSAEIEPRWNCPVHADICTETGITLSRYMMEMARLNPELEEIESIFTSLSVACKTLSNLVRTSALSGLTGLEDGGGSINVQGEEQKKLDVIANDVLKRALKWTGKLSTIASEEEDDPIGVMLDAIGNPVFSNDIIVEESGRFTAVFDPLDGSSNIDAGIPVGTIFGIFDQASEECEIDWDLPVEETENQCLKNTLQSGNNLVAAGYCLYSSATSFVFTIGNGVNGFTYDERIGEFVLTHPEIKIPSRGKIYSFNEANRWDWDEPLQDYVTDIQQALVRTKSIPKTQFLALSLYFFLAAPKYWLTLHVLLL